MNDLTAQLQSEKILTTHPLFDLWGVLRRRSNNIFLSSGQISFKHHGVNVLLPIGEINNIQINKKWIYSEIIIGTFGETYR
ncbi:hypothetical protein, partial [Serratia plymuthica]